MYFFLPSFCPFCFSSFCLFPIFFCFVSVLGVFLPALLAVLFFLFQKIFSFSFPAFCRTSFRSSCLHHPSALTRPVRPALQSLYRLFLLFACIVRFLQRPSCPKFRLQGLYCLCSMPASPSARKLTCPSLFTEPLPSFLRFACIVRFLQRPSCPNFRFQNLYCLCSMPASSVGLDPTCPRTCLGPASFFLPTFCSFSIFCRFRVVFGF